MLPKVLHHHNFVLNVSTLTLLGITLFNSNMTRHWFHVDSAYAMCFVGKDCGGPSLGQGKTGVKVGIVNTTIALLAHVGQTFPLRSSDTSDQAKEEFRMRAYTVLLST